MSDQTPTTLQRFWRKLKRGFLWTILAGVIIGTVVYVYDQRYWPFSEGTDRKAFLGATYGMTVPEVERAIGRDLFGHWAVRARFPNAKSEFAVPFGFEESADFGDSELQARYTRWYIPDITLFESPAVVKFEFFDERLMGVAVEFAAYRLKDAENVRDRVSAALAATYRGPVREDETSVPGAYRLRFANNERTAIIWFNPGTKGAAPDVSVWLSDQTGPRAFEQQRQARDATAF